jgi:hypothetical protein
MKRNVPRKVLDRLQHLFQFLNEKFQEHEYLDEDIQAIAFFAGFFIICAVVGFDLAVITSGAMLIAYHSFRFAQFIHEVFRSKD